MQLDASFGLTEGIQTIRSQNRFIPELHFDQHSIVLSCLAEEIFETGDHMLSSTIRRS
jgi:hypothetical protein